ncbi:MAG: lipid IV(A) 3-deoxy-D-manno-octulosonic acid transferase [Oceanobacter sp.]
MARLLYSLLFTLLLPLMLLKLWRRGEANPAYRKRWLERFGLSNQQGSGKPLIWIHAVSVGETQAAGPLIRHLLKHWPEYDLLVTSMTPTGSEQVRTLFGEQVLHCYLPYDHPLFLHWFFQRWQPEALMVMETELWPNLIARCEALCIPVILANARLSERSAKGYRKVSALTRPMLQRLSCVAAQNATDGQRFVELGLPVEKLTVTGSIKFDLTLHASIESDGQALRASWGAARPVLALASSHAGEDEILLQAFKTLRHDIPELLLMLIPRHPERFDSVADLVEQQGLRLSRRSQALADANAQVYLADSMGEMLLLLAATDLVVMGGSLVPTGGHNPIEPAALGKAVLMGPHCFNFSTIVEEMTLTGALAQTSEETLVEDIRALFLNDRRRNTMGQAGKELVERNRGAVVRLQQILKRLLEQP